MSSSLIVCTLSVIHLTAFKNLAEFCSLRTTLPYSLMFDKTLLRSQTTRMFSIIFFVSSSNTSAFKSLCNLQASCQALPRKSNPIRNFHFTIRCLQTSLSWLSHDNMTNGRFHVLVVHIHCR